MLMSQKQPLCTVWAKEKETRKDVALRPRLALTLALILSLLREIGGVREGACTKGNS